MSSSLIPPPKKLQATVAEEEEVLAPTAQQQLQTLTATAQRMLDGLAEAGASDQTIKSMNLLRQLIIANSSLELSAARVKALKTEKEVKNELGRDELVLSVYETLLEGLQSEESIANMKHSIGGEVVRLKRAGVQSLSKGSFFAD